MNIDQRYLIKFIAEVPLGEWPETRDWRKNISKNPRDALLFVRHLGCEVRPESVRYLRFVALHMASGSVAPLSRHIREAEKYSKFGNWKNKGES